jgi:hypothetical protein
MNQSAATQDSDQSPVSFSDSLQAASNAVAVPAVPSSVGSTSAHKQKSSSDDDQPSGTASVGHTVQQQDSSQQTPQPQQASPVLLAQLTAPIVIPVQLPLDVPVVSSDASIQSAGQPVLNVAPTARAGAASVIPQSAGSLPAAISSNRIQAGSDFFKTVPVAAVAASEGKDAATGTLPNSGKDGSDSVLSSAAQGEVQDSLQQASVVQNANSNDVASGAQAQPLQAQPAQTQPLQTQSSQMRSLQTQPLQAQPLQAQSLQTELSALQNAAPAGEANAKQVQVLQAEPSAIQNAASNAAAAVGAQTDSSTAKSAVPTTGSNPILDAALKAVSNALLNAQPLPVLHSAPKASAKEVPASTSAANSTSKTIPQATPGQSAFATSLGASNSISDQLAALTQHGTGSSAKDQANATGVNSTTAAKPSAANVSNGASNDAAGLKQHAQAASDAGSQAGSQGSNSSSDQGQSAIPVAGQSAAQPQISFADHSNAAVAPAQSAAIAPPAQSTPTLVAASGHAVKATENAAPASATAPDALPVINSARLIQSVGQTEMRVGMRSNEFGNISISTSSTRDLISAQISVDHGELAKTLAAHLPEMQSRLGGDQPMNVRIDMNGVNTGLGSGNSGGTSNGSPDQSQSGRQQAGSAASSYSGSSIPERQFSPVAAAMASGDGRLNARLDITV